MLSPSVSGDLEDEAGPADDASEVSMTAAGADDTRVPLTAAPCRRDNRGRGKPLVLREPQDERRRGRGGDTVIGEEIA